VTATNTEVLRYSAFTRDGQGGNAAGVAPTGLRFTVDVTGTATRIVAPD
jgi:predicted PhzF superfamily epimerase YddE/YHI9